MAVIVQKLPVLGSNLSLCYVVLVEMAKLPLLWCFWKPIKNKSRFFQNVDQRV